MTSWHHSACVEPGSSARSALTAWRMGASGLRSSCASMARNSSLRRSASRSATSACLRSVTSWNTRTPATIPPSRSRTGPAFASTAIRFPYLRTRTISSSRTVSPPRRARATGPSSASPAAALPPRAPPAPLPVPASLSAAQGASDRPLLGLHPGAIRAEDLEHPQVRAGFEGVSRSVLVPGDPGDLLVGEDHAPALNIGDQDRGRHLPGDRLEKGEQTLAFLLSALQLGNVGAEDTDPVRERVDVVLEPAVERGVLMLGVDRNPLGRDAVKLLIKLIANRAGEEIPDAVADQLLGRPAQDLCCPCVDEYITKFQIEDREMILDGAECFFVAYCSRGGERGPHGCLGLFIHVVLPPRRSCSTPQ